MRKPLIAANWKMNKLQRDALVFVEQFLLTYEGQGTCEVLLCPPFTSLAPVGRVISGSQLILGAQNVYWEKAGAFTGEISVEMLADCGCRYVIIGHSERRGLLDETDEDVNRKVKAALAGSLTPIICVGETLEQREAKKTQDVVTGQLRAALEGCHVGEDFMPVIAYEPVWAIGSGRSASASDAEEVAAVLREEFSKVTSGPGEAVRILYGGSVKSNNIAEFMGEPNVDGALVGGASLDVEEFSRLIHAAVGRDET